MTRLADSPAKWRIRAANLIAIFFIGVLVSGCTKEKAKAIQDSALRLEKAAGRAEIAITSWLEYARAPDGSLDTSLNKSFDDMVMGEAVSPEKLNVPEAAELEEELRELWNDQQAAATPPGIQRMNAAALETRAAVEALHQAYLFSGKPLTQMRQPLLNLGSSYVQLAQLIEKVPLGIDTPTLSKMRAILKDTTLPPKARKVMAYALYEKAFADFGARAKARSTAIASCGEAAERCLDLVDMIDNFDQLSLQELLALGSDFSGLASPLSGGAVTQDEFVAWLEAIDKRLAELKKGENADAP